MYVPRRAGDRASPRAAVAAKWSYRAGDFQRSLRFQTKPRLEWDCQCCRFPHLGFQRTPDLRLPGFELQRDGQLQLNFLPVFRVPNGLTAGQSATVTLNQQSTPGGCSDNVATSTVTFTAVAFGQTVGVPAGTFANCLKYTISFVFKDTNGTTVGTDSETGFIAPGVGIVKDDRTKNRSGQTTIDSDVLTSASLVFGQTLPSRVLRPSLVPRSSPRRR